MVRLSIRRLVVRAEIHCFASHDYTCNDPATQTLSIPGGSHTQGAGSTRHIHCISSIRIPPLDPQRRPHCRSKLSCLSIQRLIVRAEIHRLASLGYARGNRPVSQTLNIPGRSRTKEAESTRHIHGISSIRTPSLHPQRRRSKIIRVSIRRLIVRADAHCFAR